MPCRDSALTSMMTATFTSTTSCLTSRVLPERLPVNPSGDEITYRVVKVWKGGGDKRPESVTAGRYKNGVLVRNVVLNASAGWMYSWKAIDDG